MNMIKSYCFPLPSSQLNDSTTLDLFFFFYSCTSLVEDEFKIVIYTFVCFHYLTLYGPGSLMCSVVSIYVGHG